jgi:hypothetical protein
MFLSQLYIENALPAMHSKINPILLQRNTGVSANLRRAFPYLIASKPTITGFDRVKAKVEA